MEDERKNGDASTVESIDWEKARELSLSPGGFGPNRVDLWTRLLGVHGDVIERSHSADEGQETAEVKEHQDERQIKLDTDRSFVLYPVESEIQRAELQGGLHNLIISLFRKRSHLSYFQGYHDVISVLFLTLPPELQLMCAEKLSLHRVRDSMGATLEPVIGLLRVLKHIISAHDPDLFALLEGTSPLPYFALSHILTFFSHDVPSLSLTQHIFDYLLCRPPVMVVYLAAAMVLTRKAEAVALEQEGEDGMIHSVLSGLPDIFEEDGDIVVPRPDKDVADGEGGLDDHQDSLDGRSHDSSPETTQDTSLSDSAQGGSTTRSSNLSSPSDALSSSGDDPLFREKANFSAIHSEVTNGVPLELVPEVNGQIPNESDSEDPASNRSPPLSPSAIPTPPPPRISLTHLLRTADSLYESLPPAHPSIALDTIMGPQSVVFTWSENMDDLPTDDEAEKMVLRKDLIVFKEPEPEPELGSSSSDEGDHEERKGKWWRREKQTRKRRKLRKPLPVVVQRKAVVASAVLVLGVAMAVYGTGGFQRGVGDTHRTAREWRAFRNFVGAMVLGAAERLLDTVWG